MPVYLVCLIDYDEHQVFSAWHEKFNAEAEAERLNTTRFEFKKGLFAGVYRVEEFEMKDNPRTGFPL